LFLDVGTKYWLLGDKKEEEEKEKKNPWSKGKQENKNKIR